MPDLLAELIVLTFQSYC